MMLIISILLRHVLLMGAGAGVIALFALALRLMVRRDAVLSYRVMVTALIAGSALIPLQLIISERSTQSERTSPALNAPPPPPPPPPASIASEPLRSDESPLATGFFPADIDAQSSGVRSLAVRSENGAVALFTMYLLGVAAALSMNLRGLLAARRLLARSRPVTDPRVLRVWSALIADVPHPPVFLECDGLHAPACCPLGRATVLVPASFGSLDDETLASSLRHELVHLARRNGLVAALAAAAAAITWFQPLVWIFLRMLRIDREQSCDAMVVRKTRCPRTYARTLLEFCNPTTSAQPRVPLMGFESARSVRRRIIMLSHALERTSRSRRTALLTSGITCASLAFAAHAFITASVDPGSLLPNTASAATLQLTAQGDGSRMTLELHAPNGENPEVMPYKRAMELMRMREPGGLIRKPSVLDDYESFLVPYEAPKVYPQGTWVTDEQSIVHAKDAHLEDGSLHASTVSLRLPAASKLRAIFDARMIKVERVPQHRDRILVTGGSVRLVDESGTTRLRISVTRDDETLIWSEAADAASDGFELSTAAPGTGLAMQVDVISGTPEGETQSPHDSTRWKLVAPHKGNGSFDLRMLHTYDMSKVKYPEGC
jgi:beta-lactamase regulating signal transducer with metallopeptidase domain